MSYFYGWLTILSISLLGAMIPGISFALVLRNTLHSSRSTGIWTAAGLSAGISVYTLIVLFGLALVILHNTFLMNAIRWGGAAYLAYIGIHCLLAKPKNLKNINVHSGTRISTLKALRMGFLTNLLNPKVMLFFIALFTQFIHPDMPAAISWIYGLTIAIVEFSWFTFVAILLTHPLLFKHFQKVSHWIERLSGCILLFISLHLVISQI
jgi:RhtB (resistance to homoserine/threonine) family protein